MLIIFETSGQRVEMGLEPSASMLSERIGTSFLGGTIGTVDDSHYVRHEEHPDHSVNE